jgi:hypothetical protein
LIKLNLLLNWLNDWKRFRLKLSTTQVKIQNDKSCC